MGKYKTCIAICLSVLLLSLTPSSASTLNQTLTYDGNGNLISGDGKTRTYNEFNQLVRVSDSTTGLVLEEYIYHPTEDRILIKRVNNEDSFNDTDRTIAYINDNFVRDYDIDDDPRIVVDTYYAKDENGIVGEVVYNGTVHDASLSFVKRLFYHNDHLGSISVITNTSGGLVEETTYAPYGEILQGGEESRYQYEGKEFSSATGDYDFHFRKYNPELGIFTQPEQIFPDVYDPQQLNRYAFERRNPYSYVDPDGKFVVLAPLLIAAGIGALGGLIAYQFTTPSSERTTGGYLTYAGGGALGGLIATAAVLFAPTLVGATATQAAVIGGGAGGFANQFTVNLGLGNPLFQNTGQATLFGLLSAGLAEEFLPYTRPQRITTYSSSYFTTRTGRLFIGNTFSQESFQTALSIAVPSSINLAQGSGNCNSAYSTCLPQSSSSSNGGNGGGSSGSHSSPRGSGGCGITMSCPSNPGCGVTMSCI